MKNDPGNRDNRQFAAVCGLYCPACTLYIGSTEEPERLARTAGRFNVSVEEARCYGCRSDVQSFYCQACEIKKCADERGLEFCALCDEYPCQMLKEFQAQLPHRAELFEDGERIREVGYDQWFEEVRARYTCPSCSAINSAYDLACRKCGNEPGSPFAERHRERIHAVLEKIAANSE
jgi:hypothetical protein